MNKFVLRIVMVAVVAIAIGTTSLVSAQSPTPQTTVPGTGTGMMNGRGGRGMMQSAPASQDGLLHDGMIAAYAEALNISVDDLNTRLANGETMGQIASSAGLTADQFLSLMKDARTQAVDQAVSDGTLTQAQADWMKLRGAGAGRGGRGSGARGAGLGQFANPDCPYYQANP